MIIKIGWLTCGIKLHVLWGPLNRLVSCVLWPPKQTADGQLWEIRCLRDTDVGIRRDQRPCSAARVMVGTALQQRRRDPGGHLQEGIS